MTVSLNDEQATAILTEGLARSLYENGGAIPEDEKVRLKDATDLVNAALAASNNGNKSDNVNTILFLAQVDQKPITSGSEEPVVDQKPTIAQNPPVVTPTNSAGNEDVKVEMGESPAETAPSESSPIQGFDIAQVSDGVLEGLIIGLDKFPNNENVENERKAYYAEKERRAGAKGQEIPQGEAAQEAPNKAGEISAEVPAAGIPAGDQVSGAVGGQDGAAGDGTGVHAEQDSAQGEDAGAFARAQTPETSKEGKAPKAKATEEDGERAEIEAQLTLPMVKAHGIDLTKLLDLSTEQLKFVVENPEGAPEKENKQMAINEQEVEQSAVPNENLKAVGGISAEVAVPVQTVSKADLGLSDTEEDETPGAISADRERMEAVLTGPILKAYGRGRKQVPSIGDNELKFMIMNPAGKVTPEELEAARALDNAGSEVEQKVENSIDFPIEGQGEKIVKDDPSSAQIPPKEDNLIEVTLPSGKVIKVDQSIVEAEEKEAIKSETDRTITEAAKESVSKTVPSTEATADNEAGPIVEKTDYDDGGKSVVVDKSLEQNRAMEIISNENMPVPPNYKDEQAPVFPMDVSAISRDELFSLHARFHAYEIRMNWILMQHEDEMNDCTKLREYREATVAKEIPFMGEDGKRNTNEFRDAQVRGDKEVLDLGMKEHEAKKIVTDLKVLRNIYHLDCERLSRQMSKYENERLDAPR